MNITIRSLSEVDMPLLKAIYSQSIQRDFPEFSQGIRDFLTTGRYEAFSMSLPIKLGAFDGEKLAGFLLADKHFGGVVYVMWLAIAKDYQKKGIGTKLLAEIEKIALGVGAHQLLLETFERDIDFYKKKGFEMVGLNKKGYFGTDNYVMSKAIQEPKEENFLK